MGYISGLITYGVFAFMEFFRIPPDYVYIIDLVTKIILVILVIMIAVAYATWLERKVHAWVSLRKGPNVVGPIGLLQPIVDGLKLILKETIIPRSADKFIFILAPCVTFIVALMGWVVMPLEYQMAFSNMNVGVLYILAVSSLGVYGVIMAGWASNSQYAFLGAIRTAAQMISYELAMGLLIVCVVMVSGSLNLSEIVMQQQDLWYVFPMFPIAVLFYITILAETKRHPFDLPESEADIVSGYHIEYSGFAFALFFLAEYASMILMCSFFTVLFLGGWLPILDIGILTYIPGFVWFSIKVIFLLFLMIQIKSVTPRYRYDQLMRLGWKVFLPLSLVMVVVVAFFIRYSI